jgi:hypothetical protein
MYKDSLAIIKPIECPSARAESRRVIGFYMGKTETFGRKLPSDSLFSN